MTDNYCIDRKKLTKNEEFLLLDEVNSKCPLCGKFLILDNHKKTREFEIAHIYPNSPTTAEKKILHAVTRLGSNSEDLQNKIALCKSCHGNYDNNKTLEEYNDLKKIKEKSLNKQRSKIKISAITIEDEITSVIKALDNLDADSIMEIKELSLSALRVTEKIDRKYGILIRTINRNVAEYYYIIQQMFKELDQNKKLNFNIVASQIRTAYLTCESNEKEQDAIFESLTQWLKGKTKGTDDACKIIISFFVQNCEVYDKITQ